MEKIGFIKYKKEPITRTCDQCGREFKTYIHNAKRCSKECVNKYRAKFEKNKRANLEKNKRYSICIICGKKFELLGKSQAKTCSIECGKILRKKSIQKYRNLHLEEIKNRDEIYRNSEKRKEWREKNKNKINKWINENAKKRRKIDPEYKLRCALQRSLLRYLGQTGKTKKIIDYVNYTPKDLKEHLESKFKEGMTWENHGLFGWHIDHIMPVSSFKFYDKNGIIDKEEVKKCMALDNLQPLWSHDNLTKSNKIIIGDKKWH